MCVQICKDWDLTTDMPLTGAGWGIIYLLIVHDEHPDTYEHDKQVGLDDIVVGEKKERVDPAAQEQRKRRLERVKREEGEMDDERVGPENNPGILKLSKELEAKAKKPRHH